MLGAASSRGSVLHDRRNWWGKGSRARGLRFLSSEIKAKSSAHQVRLHDLAPLLLFTREQLPMSGTKVLLAASCTVLVRKF